MTEIIRWEKIFHNFLSGIEFKDSSHDLNHFKRVAKIAKQIASEEDNVDELVILAAAYFHDIISFPKDDPKRSRASYYASMKAGEILRSLDFPEDKINPVKHCILTHSYSANIDPETIEAKIVQDADRMEAIGAIGLARVFYVSGQLGSQLFNSSDPFAQNRELEDRKFALDHFYVKLLGLKDTMKTLGGKSIAEKRTKILEEFLENIKNELL